MNTEQAYYPRQFMARIIFSWLFIVLVYFFLNNTLLSQLKEPVFIYPGSDNSFWLLHILRIPQFFLQHHAFALAFDILLTVSCIICIVVPDQRLFTYITVIGTWFFYFFYSSAAGKEFAQIGYLLAPVPFLALKQSRFSLLWDSVRYWVCFLYLSGGVYKIYYGGAGYADNMSNILQQMNAEWFLFHKDGIQAGIIHYLVGHPSISQWLFRLAVIVDLAMIVGFFTRRFDKWLLAGLVSFHVCNYFLLHISFIEQSLIFAPFLPWQKLSQYFQSNNSDD